MLQTDHTLTTPTPFPSRLRRYTVALITLLFSFSAWAELNSTLPGTNISITSSKRDGVLSAEISSIVHYPFEVVATSLARADSWCQFMPLHFNIKACTHESQLGETQLTLYSGRKGYQTASQSFLMAYDFEILHQDNNHLSLHLQAARGPANTRDYRIKVDTMKVEGGTLLHINSSYRPSLLSELLTRSYLTTLGRNKVGFSKIIDAGESRLVQGIRGVIERNVMRSHLAIDAYLSTQPLAEASRHEAALSRWFSLNDGYPEQLHEMEKSEYLLIKRQEWQNQQRLQQALNDRLQLASNPVRNSP